MSHEFRKWASLLAPDTDTSECDATAPSGARHRATLAPAPSSGPPRGREQGAGRARGATRPSPAPSPGHAAGAHNTRLCYTPCLSSPVLPLIAGRDMPADPAGRFRPGSRGGRAVLWLGVSALRVIRGPTSRGGEAPSSMEPQRWSPQQEEPTSVSYKASNTTRVPSPPRLLARNMTLRSTSRSAPLRRGRLGDASDPAWRGLRPRRSAGCS